jgi:hypothetical protein
MNLLGLPTWTYAAGLAGLAGMLLMLHMLRVRLRRQRVDSLLFFRQVGAVHKPRVLLGLPSRFWSYLLGLALLGTAFTTFADPVDAADGPSRVVLVDASSGVDEQLRGELAAEAARIADESGLGPRGRIVSFGETPTALFRADEPAKRLGERLDTVPAQGAPSTFWDGLRAAAAGLDAGDEIVVLGGPTALPASASGVPVVRGAFGSRGGTAIARVDVEHTPAGRQLRIEASTNGQDAEVLLRDGAEVLARATLRTTEGATAPVTLGPIDARARPALAVELALAGTVAASAPVPVERSRPTIVHVAPGVEACVRAAVEAAPQLALTDDPADAEILVVADASASASSAERPHLAFVPGMGAGERLPRTTPANPLPLSLRDRRRVGSALPPGDGAIWVEDTASGSALVRRTAAGIEAVDWLLDDPTHRDVPTLVCGALLELAAPVPGSPWQSALPPTSAEDPASVELVDVADPFPWSMALLACALAALLLDGWLHHRGRVA